MSRLIKSFSILLFFAVLLSLFSGCAERPQQAILHKPNEIGYIPITQEQYDPPALHAKQFFIYDVKTECFLCIKGEKQVVYPASIQKLLTILYALTLLDRDTSILPGEELSLLGENSSLAYIKSYHVLTVEQLIEGMLLPSGNDAALTLAAAAGKTLKQDSTTGIEAVNAFVNGMNAYAKEIGLIGSHFTDPSGYSEDQYSTLEDLALIALRAYENDLIMNYAGMVADDVVYQSGHQIHWKNTNLCLDPTSEYYLSEATGLKTGTLNNHYYNLLISYQIEGQDYIAGFFGTTKKNDRFEDAVTVANWIRTYRSKAG